MTILVACTLTAVLVVAGSVAWTVLDDRRLGWCA